jgi:succinate dehydrogenase / fumarate reductase, cytochrome b subunit
MSLALHKESFFWHKLHSLTGIVPVGFYMVQHLVLNSFSLAGPRAYDAVGDFFYSIPIHMLLAIEVGVVWLPLLFHAVYGIFIVNRGQANYVGTKYSWAENRMYWLQRISGLFLFFFLIFHILTTTGKVKVTGDHTVVNYAGMQAELMKFGGLILVLYAISVIVASYHLAFGIWNFTIRWGITVSDQAQARIRKFAVGAFAFLTLLGWAALAGFFMHKPRAEVMAASEPAVVSQDL